MAGRRRADGRASRGKGQLGFWIIVGTFILVVLAVFFVPIIVFM